MKSFSGNIHCKCETSNSVKRDYNLIAVENKLNDQFPKGLLKRCYIVLKLNLIGLNLVGHDKMDGETQSKGLAVNMLIQIITINLSAFVCIYFLS